MDDAGHIAYVTRAMNLLLLLSALLSALTGAGVGSRRPEVSQAVSVHASASRPIVAAVTTRAWRPVSALPVLIVSAALDASWAPVRLAPADLWASRRRE